MTSNRNRADVGEGAVAPRSVVRMLFISRYRQRNKRAARQLETQHNTENKHFLRISEIPGNFFAARNRLSLYPSARVNYHANHARPLLRCPYSPYAIRTTHHDRLCLCCYR